jgi:hypothetical protein
MVLPPREGAGAPILDRRPPGWAVWASGQDRSGVGQPSRARGERLRRPRPGPVGGRRGAGAQRAAACRDVARSGGDGGPARGERQHAAEARRAGSRAPSGPERPAPVPLPVRPACRGTISARTSPVGETRAGTEAGPASSTCSSRGTLRPFRVHAQELAPRGAAPECPPSAGKAYRPARRRARGGHPEGSCARDPTRRVARCVPGLAGQGGSPDSTTETPQLFPGQRRRLRAQISLGRSSPPRRAR